MPRYMAFLRGVSPVNAKMPDLRRSFEAAGFKDVATILASGNVAFTARSGSEVALAKKAEASMNAALGRSFPTIVRPSAFLERLLDADPFSAFAIAPGAKRVVTFLRVRYRGKAHFPVEADGARILGVAGREAFTAYLPSPRGPVFMDLIEKTFGKDVTTRTWDTVRKCASA